MALGGLYVAVQVVDPSTGRVVGTTARIDTGDDIALVDPSVIQALGSSPSGSDAVQGVGGAPETGQQYTLDVNFGSSGPARGYAAGITCVSIPIASSLGIGILAGDNILDLGVLVRDGPGRYWSFSVEGAPVPGPSPWPSVGIIGAAVGAGMLAWGLWGK